MKTRSLAALEAADAADVLVSLDSLEGDHRHICSQAVRNILSTEIGELTLAQLVDGLPLSEVEADTFSGHGYITWGHPLHTKHKELCPGVLEKARQLYDTFDIGLIRMRTNLLHDFRISAPGSKAFNIKLIEITAVSIHQLAVHVYSLPDHFHKDDGIASWKPEEEHKYFQLYNPKGPPPTLFQHRQYRAYKQYPNGVADGVGYWAESRIFGGVLLFDRREPGSAPDVDAEAVYLHPERRDVTYRICKLLDPQKLKLIRFLLSENTKDSSPLPFLMNEKNSQRVDPEEDLEVTGIYRDLWERKRQTIFDEDRRFRGHLDTIDFPSYEDYLRAAGSARERRDRQYSEYNEDEDSGSDDKV